MLQTLRKIVKFTNSKLHSSIFGFQNIKVEKVDHVRREDNIKAIQHIQEIRRKVEEDLFVTQRKLQDNIYVLPQTFMDDDKYSSAVTQIHELLKQQGHLQEAFSSYGQKERELQTTLAEAIKSSQEHAAAIKSSQEHAAAIKSSQEHAAAIKSSQEHAAAIKSSQEHAAAIKSSREHAAAIKSSQEHERTYTTKIKYPSLVIVLFVGITVIHSYNNISEQIGTLLNQVEELNQKSTSKNTGWF